MNILKLAFASSVLVSVTAAMSGCIAETSQDAGATEDNADALKKNKCLTVKCTASTTCEPTTGKCIPKPNKCLRVKCWAGAHCEPTTGGCVQDAPAECANVRCMAGTQNVPGLGCCLPTCGGLIGKACANGTSCVDVPNDGCDPKNGGADCGGVCITKPADPCMTIKCSSGHHCDSAAGACVQDAPADCSTVRCAAGTVNIPGVGCCLKQCGGFAGIRCDASSACSDIPNDGCDPKNGGADCGGYCAPIAK